MELSRWSKCLGTLGLSLRCRSSKKLKSFGYWVHKVHLAPNLASQHGPVKKKNAQIRCCIDFHDLNNACLEDEFSLSNIDMLVDAIDGQSMFSFTVEVSGYNHIKMDMWFWKDCFSNSHGKLSLHGHVVWPKKCKPPTNERWSLFCAICYMTSLKIKLTTSFWSFEKSVNKQMI